MASIQSEVRALLESWSEAARIKDVDRLMCTEYCVLGDRPSHLIFRERLPSTTFVNKGKEEGRGDCKPRLEDSESASYYCRLCSICSAAC